MTNHAPAWRSIYERVAPFLALMIFLLALAAGVGTYVNDRNDRERDRAITALNSERIADQERLLSCFDKFATALAGGLPPVRQASAVWNDAVAGVVSGLTDALVKTLNKQVVPADVQAVIDAGRSFVAANTALSQARTDNPYPDAPSRFCGD